MKQIEDEARTSYKYGQEEKRCVIWLSYLTSPKSSVRDLFVVSALKLQDNKHTSKNALELLGL